MVGATAIEIFRPGTHTAESGRAIAFSAADLAAIAAGYDPTMHEAPIVVGHPTTDAPAYGWISGLQVVAGSLQATPHQVDQSFAEMVRAGRFKKVSASFYAPDSPANPKPGQWYLKHVGFLGAVPPAIKGLKQVAFNAAETGVETFAETWSMGLVARLFGSLRDMLIAQFGADAADKALPRDTIDTIATAEPPIPRSVAPDTYYAEPPAKEQPVPEPDPAAVAALEARERTLREAEAAFAERERAARAAADEAFVADLVAAGRLPKALAATAATLLTRAPEGDTASFAEGIEAETDRAALRRMLAALPVAVEFREVAAGDEPLAAGADAQAIARAAEAHQKAEADKGHTISFREAVLAVTKEKRA